MKFFIIAIAAFFASGLTLFSGFGLGTLLMPFFAIFFPVDVAIAMTAIVHLANNFFKLVLLGKYADKGVVIRFGLPAIGAAFLGAKTLFWVSHLSPWLHYQWFGHIFEVTPVKFIVALLMILFAVIEWFPAFEKISFGKRLLPIGGILSGFLGGISGHQGALRGAFLIKCGLSRESYIGTGVVIACLVDICRLSVYFTHFSWEGIQENHLLLIAGVLSAFLGAFIGNRFVKKVTLKTIQAIVSVLLLVIAACLGFGII